MEVVDSTLAEVKFVRLDVIRDERGSFAETYDAVKFAALGIRAPFVHDSWSLSRNVGTVRGFHFQKPPRAQHKLVRVTRGRILDVVVDIRRGSPTFGSHVAVELSAEKPLSLFVPIGFAHAFCTLEGDTEVTYKMSDHFVPRLYTGLFWADPQLAIPWPVKPGTALLSPKDKLHPHLADIESPFVYRTAV
jgi:dTDP-4-dehydrorhamnose 3,5-epimerase